MNHDPYEILGVSREATAAELKRAFRRLAMRWHPDRNDHPEATERFKEISLAYELLTDPEEDEEVGEAPPEDSPPAPADNETTEDAFAEESGERAARAADIRLNLEISLEEAALGYRKGIHYNRGKACSTCDGSGEHGMARTRFCGDCHGSGRVRDAQRALVRCDACGGRGFFSERICPDCGGSGREIAEVSLEINVPPGMLAGDELRLAGQGEQGSEGQRPGHLYLTLIIRSHDLFQLVGRDLHCSMPVSALAMMAGGEIELPTLSGSLSHRLEAGIAERRDLRLAGKGYPGRGRNPAGDLVVELTPIFPSRLNAKQRKLLLQADAALLADMAEALPEIAAWRANHRPD